MDRAAAVAILALLIDWLKGGQSLPLKTITAIPNSSSQHYPGMVSLSGPPYGPENVTVEEFLTPQAGMSVLLYCSANSVPTASFTWTFNGTVMDVNTASYLIQNSTYNNSGVYTCTASNSVTKQNSSAIHVLRIIVPDLGTGPAVGITIAVMAGVILLCLALFFCIKYSRCRCCNNQRPLEGLQENVYDNIDLQCEPAQSRETQDSRIYSNQIMSRETQDSRIYSNQIVTLAQESQGRSRVEKPRIPAFTASK